MKSKAALFDNDITYKLIISNLWEEILLLNQIGKVYCRSAVGIGQFQSMIRKKEQSLYKNSKSVLSDQFKSKLIEKFNAALPSISRIPAEWHRQEISANFICEGIDFGEAELLAIALSQPVLSFFYTGDKKFIHALRKNFHDDYNRMIQNNQLICFEECLLKLLDSYGYEWLYERLVSARQMDGTVDLILGVSKKNSPEEFRNGLISSHPISYS